MKNLLLLLRKSVVVFCCVTFFCAIEGHVFVVQTVAWTKMVYEFSKTDTISKALEKTFDGEHFCEICLKLKRIKQGLPQLKTDNLIAKNLVLYGGAIRGFNFNLPGPTVDYEIQNFKFESIELSPRLMPPRCA